MSNTPDYKSTVRLPQTDFPMKGNLNVKEPEILSNWKDKKIYQRVVAKNASHKKFVLPDGPPYANGSIHMGHCLNKILKDIIIKYKNMTGFSAAFIPGWDCHGLPIEHKVMKDLSEKKLKKTDDEILQLCREEALTWVNHQREQFKRLGILADWENPYLTMSKEYEAEEVREFAKAFKKGVIYRGEKPVFWNWALKTALADAEVEYHDHKSPAVYVKFPVTDAATLKKIGSKNSKVNFVIWTTTPWTLPANVAICLHPDFEYGIYEINNEAIVVAKALKEFFEKDTGHTLTLEKTIKGVDLEKGKARHPWIDRDSVIILGSHVTQDAGTGAVHTAPGHGVDDFRVGQTYQLPVLCPVDDCGLFTDDVPEYKGQNIFKVNPLIVERLKASGLLLGYREITHSYPHSWRSKTPLIYRTTPQWFLGIDLEGSEIRAKTMKALNDIEFYPDWGEARFRAMIEGRPDWCLSRQRIWGVPIPIYYCKATGEPLADADIMMRIADVIEKNGIEAFWKTAPEDVIANFSVKGKFGSEGFKHGRDILDVWFDSGICHAAVQKLRPELGFPADIYLEGSDQHRGWFNTSMLSSMATNGVSPFKALLTHGMVTDSQGRKMSKSVGNYVDPQSLTDKSGAEIIRLWVAYSDYGRDVGCGTEELTRVTETYRRFRNTLRFLLGAISDFDFTKDQIPIAKMTKLDQWALSELAVLTEKVTDAYENYEFYKVYHLINNFFTVTMSATYLDVLKDRLYTWKADGVPRRSAQTVIYQVTDYVIRMMAPIVSFLSEEAYSHFKGKTEESVFLLNFPIAPKEWENENLTLHFENLLKVRSEVQRSLEELRAQKTIGSSLESTVTISAEGTVLEDLTKAYDLREFLIVSEVHLKSGPFKVEAGKAPGNKCLRCWIYSKDTGQSEKFPEICPKCVEALT